MPLSYITPIFDRTIVDIQTKTPKAFLNVSDWNRIYGNAAYASNYVATLFGVAIPFDVISAPDTFSFASVADVNKLLANINRIPVTIDLAPDTISRLSLVYWMAGPYVKAPDYEAVNRWEYIIDQIIVICTVTASYWVHSGVGACGQTRFWQNRFRSYE